MPKSFPSEFENAKDASFPKRTSSVMPNRLFMWHVFLPEVLIACFCVWCLRDVYLGVMHPSDVCSLVVFKARKCDVCHIRSSRPKSRQKKHSVEEKGKPVSPIWYFSEFFPPWFWPDLCPFRSSFFPHVCRHGLQLTVFSTSILHYAQTSWLQSPIGRR